MLVNSIFHSPSVFLVILLSSIYVCWFSIVRCARGICTSYACVFDTTHICSTQTCSVKHYTRPLYNIYGGVGRDGRPPPYRYNSRIALPFMWGSLRLAPIKLFIQIVAIATINFHPLFLAATNRGRLLFLSHAYTHAMIDTYGCVHMWICVRT